MLHRLRSKNLHTWSGGYARHLWRRATVGLPHRGGHVLFALCDHFEPRWGDASRAVADARVVAWHRRYAAYAQEFRDSDGRPPRHTFFFPAEQYEPAHLDALGELSSSGYGEVECHLHHDADSAAGLRERLDAFVRQLGAHGHLSTDLAGRSRFAFVHGNWCLANARPDGRWCGVDRELEVLFDAGCYADFTFPAAPDVSQPNIVNQIYWPIGDLGAARCYEQGESARVGQRRRDRLLLIQGPLALTRRAGGILPRIENGALTVADPPTARRVRGWVRQHIHIDGRPEWVFVKVHAHGCADGAVETLLGAGGRALHRALVSEFGDGERWRLHYVTAREMYNIACAAMEGESGDPGDYRDYLLPPPAAAIASRITAACSPARARR